ncbi:class I SAM-dependent methyltransferase [Streptomyces sp. NPDC126522]|uniref:class I SAM-dependent methyltransferase n=1 Tax=Streptomyces sp. NPDC126522 TaxID=3155211 RepID=UPI0033192926
MPRGFGRALDVGCGTGDLARLLTVRTTGGVEGIDSDPEIIGRSRVLTPPGVPVVFTVVDARDGIPAGPYDVITCVAALHHLPFAETLTRFRDQLAPGGTLVVVGCAREADAVDSLLGAVSVALNVVTGWLKNRGRRGDPGPAEGPAPAVVVLAVHAGVAEGGGVSGGQGAFGVWELAGAGEWGGLVTWSVPVLGCRNCSTA